MKFDEIRIVVRGGGDLATGVVYRLHRAGFAIVVTELSEPLVVRRTVALAEAMYAGKVDIEGMVGVKVGSAAEAEKLAHARGVIPVVSDPEGGVLSAWQPQVVVDAVLAKRNILRTALKDAQVVIGLGPGFTAGKDVHAVIETQRGHFLGRVLYSGQAAPNTGIPGLVEGIGRERVVYSPVEGFFTSPRTIGEMIEAGDIFGKVGETPVYAAIGGCIRGLLHPGIKVRTGVKIGDIDPRRDSSLCYTISDKALAIGGAVLEAVLAGLQNN